MTAFAIPLFGLVAITAEVVSMQGVVGAGVTTAGRLLVITIILIGMAFVVASASMPRLRHIYTNLPGEDRRVRPLLRGVLVFSVLALGFSIIFRVNQTLRTSQSNARALAAKWLLEQDQVVVRRMEARTRRENAIKNQITSLHFKDGLGPADKFRLRTLKAELSSEMQANRFDVRLDNQLHRHAYYLLSHR